MNLAQAPHEPNQFLAANRRGLHGFLPQRLCGTFALLLMLLGSEVSQSYAVSPEYPRGEAGCQGTKAKSSRSFAKRIVTAHTRLTACAKGLTGSAIFLST